MMFLNRGDHFEPRPLPLEAQFTPAFAPLVLKMAVFMPISRPAESSSGPPELPGLIAASVWIAPRMRRRVTDSISRSSALTMPRVSVRCRPKGLPIA